MESKLKTEIAVGIFFFVSMAILGYYTVIMSHEILQPDNQYSITVQFRDAGGLTEKSKVFVNGVMSGTVESVTLRENRVEVVLTLFNDFTLYDNYKVRIKSDAVLGGKQVSIVPGEATDQLGNVHGAISRDSLLQGTLEDPFSSITNLIEENRANIYASISNIRQFTEKLNRGKGSMAKLLNDDSIATETETLIKELRETVEDAREQAPVTSFIRAALTAF